MKLVYHLVIGLFCLGVLGATAALAGCPQGQEPFTSCQIEGRNTEVFVCFDDQLATYRYGPVGGTPDLFLSEPVDRVDYEPWSGQGTAISESITFYNGDYAYNVGGGFDRPFSEEEMQKPLRRFGWVEVAQSGARAAYLECKPDTVGYGFGGGIHDIKVAAGLSWDAYSVTWVSDLVQPPDTPLLVESHHFSTVEFCLPASEFNLGGVHMGDPSDGLGKLGSPEMINDPNNVGEDIDRMTLRGAYIDIFQDTIVAMSATSPNWKTPSGLSVGLTRGEVIRILGHPPSGYTATSPRFLAYVCTDDPVPDPEWTMLIEFGQDKRVKAIHFFGISH